MLIQEKPHGITDISKEFLQKNLSRIGTVIKIEGWYEEDDHGWEYWVDFIDSEGNTIRCNGFSWGYAGTGPHGLMWASELVGISMSMEEIVDLPQSGFTKTR